MIDLSLFESLSSRAMTTQFAMMVMMMIHSKGGQLTWNYIFFAQRLFSFIRIHILRLFCFLHMNWTFLSTCDQDASFLMARVSNQFHVLMILITIAACCQALWAHVKKVLWLDRHTHVTLNLPFRCLDLIAPPFSLSLSLFPPVTSMLVNNYHI